MSVKNFWPDTPKEYAFIGSSVGRLGTAMSGILLFQENHIWVLASLVLTWIGYEINGYFKLQEEPSEEKQG